MKYLFLLSAIVMLASCSPKSEKKASINLVQTEAATPINFIGQWLNEGQRENLVRDFVRNYEFKNQEVRVNLSFPEEVYFDRSDAESEPRFFAEQISKGIPDWDIVRVNGDYEAIADFLGDPEWPAKYFVDFSQYPEFINNVSPDIDLNQIKNRWHGIVPGPLLEGQYYSLWTNVKVAEKLGIEVKQFGMTFNDFLTYIQTAYQYNQNNPDNKITIWHEAGDWNTVFMTVIQLYVSIINDKEAIYSNNITQEKLNAWHKTLQCLEQLSVYQPIDENWRDVTWGESQQDLPNEKCLFYSNGSWMYNIWVEKNPDKVRNCMPIEYPGFNKAVIYPTVYPVMWGVLKNSPNKEEAVNMMLAMNKPEMAELWVRQTKCPTGIKGNLTEITFGSDHFENFFYYLKKNYAGNGYKMRENSLFILGADYQYNENYFMEVLIGEMSADQAMNKIMENIPAL